MSRLHSICWQLQVPRQTCNWGAAWSMHLTMHGSFNNALLSGCALMHNMRVLRLRDKHVEVVAWMLVLACASQCAWTGKQWLTCACHLRVAVQCSSRALRLTDSAACRLCISCQMQVHICEAFGLCIGTISPQAF